jgi:magnesium-transporting ATPase (P-type)
MTSATLEGKTNLWPAVLLFSVTYLALSAVVAAVLTFFDLNSNTGLSIGVLMAATGAAARKFVADHRRALHQGEQLRFALLAIVATMLLTVLQVAVVILIFFKLDELPQLAAEAQAWAADNTTLLAVIAAFVVLLFFAALYFGAGWFSRWFAKRLAATGSI